MKERSILFNGQMVKAILEDRKTQTRREKRFATPFDHASAWPFVSKYSDGGWVWTDFEPTKEDLEILRKNGNGCNCPYGQPGDRLWVKETFSKDNISSNGFIYRQNWPLSKPPQGWTPSIHMSRKASRITLEITGVRAERLQAICKADVLAEGTPGFELEKGSEDECRACYKQLWESINGKGSWDKNPWVWVVEFKRIKP